MRVLDLLGLEPLDEEGEVVRYLLAVEDAVYHVAAEESHLDLVARVRVDLRVFVDGLEDVGGGRAVGKLQLVEGLLLDGQLVAALEVFDGHVLEDRVDLVVGVLEHQVRLHVFLLQLAHELLVLGRLGGLQPALGLDVDLLEGLRKFVGGEVVEERVGVEEVGFEEVKLGCESLCIAEVGGVVVEQLNCALLQVLSFADLEEDFLKLPLKVFRLSTDDLLLKQMGPGLVFGLHLAIKTILFASHLILLVLFNLFQLLVEDDIVLELILVLREELVLDYVGEGHSFLTVHHEDPFEEILQVGHLVLELVLLGEGCGEGEGRVRASPLYLRLHVVTCISG